MVKILYPDGSVSHDDALELINFAIEGRKRVKDQLTKMDDTFEKVDFTFKDLFANKTIEIETLENLKYLNRQERNIADFTDETNAEEKEKEISLKSGQVIIRDNQEGISYESLFARYLTGAKKVTLVDPYLRMPYQMKQLIEFCLVLVNNKGNDEEIELNVITWNEPDEMLKLSTENLNEIAESVFDLGIKMTFEFNPNLHDRFIQADNGWKIVLGRGLDIFLKPEGKFDIAEIHQKKRKCRACEITYILLSS